MKVKRVSPDESPFTPVDKAPAPELGTDIIAKERYTSADFMQKEWDQLWSKVWLMAGREDDMPEPGDYMVADIGRESVIVVRQLDGGVRAFYNVCQHRGNQLREKGIGHADSFLCAYHHWDFNLDGSIKNIPDLDTFPQGAPCSGLAELPCDTWGSWVWFSLDPEVEPLRDYLNVIPQHLDPYNFDRMVLTRDLTVVWDCNWKAAVDAFNETYHVQGIHPQLLWHLNDQDVQIDCYDKHSRYMVPFGTLSPRVNQRPPEIPAGIKEMMTEAGMDPADYDGRVLDIRRDIQKFMRENGESQGKDFSRLNDDQLTDDYHYFIFPNITMNIHATSLMLFRQRPHETDPNKMYFDINTYFLPGKDDEIPDRPEHKTYNYGEKSCGLVIDQDAHNLPGVQKGMNSKGYRGLWLSDQELRIRHFHKTIDDYIYGPGKKPKGAL